MKYLVTPVFFVIQVSIVAAIFVAAACVALYRKAFA